MVAQWAGQAARQSEQGAEKPKRSGKQQRKDRQHLKEKYAKTRENAQLAGIIPTVPEGAVRPEVVNPATQEEQDMTHLDRAAINLGWAVPEDKKQQIVDRLTQKALDAESSAKEVAMCANALLKADQMQYERDNPAAAKGSTNTTINTAVHVDIGDLLRRIRAQREQSERVIDVSPPR